MSDICTTDLFLHMRVLYQRALTRQAPDVVSALRTVGHCGGSEVKHDINTVQFLTQTDHFVSLDLNVSSRAAGIHLVLSKPWVPLTAIT